MREEVQTAGREGSGTGGAKVALFALVLLWTIPGLAQDMEDKSVPARDHYENIQIFTSDAVSAAFLDRLMEEISFDLGVGCEHCHDPENLARAELSAEKQRVRNRIREMWNVVSTINQDHFQGKGGLVRCWTCHRGAAKPERFPAELAGGAFPGLFPEAAEGVARASESYENLQVLGDVPTSELETGMELMAALLGFQCTDCHEGDDFASDEKQRKQTARSMMRMVRTIDDELFPDENGPTCWTCHRGSSQPEFLRPDR